MGAAPRKFLELSGVGRVMADGTDEDGAYAARMDEWVAWETVEEQPRGAKGNSCIPPRGVTIVVAVYFALLYLFLTTLSCKGGSHPETCAQRTAEGGGFPLSW
jgi:hypothetical protein